jgi:hypothetical protein
MHFVKDNKLNVPDQIRAFVQHRSTESNTHTHQSSYGKRKKNIETNKSRFNADIPQDLCGHNQTCSFLVDLDVAGYETNILKFVLEIAILLVRERLDWTCVDRPDGRMQSNHKEECQIHHGPK